MTVEPTNHLPDAGAFRNLRIRWFDNLTEKHIIARMNWLIHSLILKRSCRRQLTGSLIFLVFFVGVLLLPAWHELKGNEDKAQRDTCPVCRVAHIPMDVPIQDLEPTLVPSRTSDPAFVASATVLGSCQRGPTQARAPPAI
jgi:hypothetical protein